MNQPASPFVAVRPILANKPTSVILLPLSAGGYELNATLQTVSSKSYRFLSTQPLFSQRHRFGLVHVYEGSMGSIMNGNESVHRDYGRDFAF